MLGIVFIVIVLFLAYCFFCVDESKGDIKAKFKIYLIRFLEKVIPLTIRQYMDKFLNYVLNKPNPLIQIIYLILVIGLFIIYKLFGIDEFLPNERIPYINVYFGYFLLGISLFSFYLACRSNPGIITKKELPLYQFKYEYDQVMYFKNECRTCKFLKVPRSKHCSICDHCVDKFDHHCIWINQCVGSKNYKYFLSYIGLHAVLCGYGFLLGCMFFLDFIESKGLLRTKYMNQRTKEVLDPTYYTVFRFVMNKHYTFFSCLVMLITISIMLASFFLYHMFLIYLNLTTNERIKRSRMIKYLNYIQKTAKENIELKQITEGKDVKGIDEDMDQKFREIIFDIRNFEKLNKLEDKEFFPLILFTNNWLKKMNTNKYNVGFFKNIKTIIKGK